MTTPEIAICVTTYQRPNSLALVLESIAAQRCQHDKLEVVVSDDGSTDHTAEVVESFRRRASFPVQFITHSHETFQAARCRNAAAASTSADYLLFLDGDCVLPPQHVATHLARRQRGVAFSGDVCRMDQAASKNLTDGLIRRGDFAAVTPPAERRRLRMLDLKYRLYNLICHPTKPRSLRSGDFSIWRADFLRVNGFDENFCGWGGEDDDLGRRLRRAGIRMQPLLRWTYSYHLWHPREASVPKQPKTAANAHYLTRKGRLTRCRNGLVKRSLNELDIRIVGHPAATNEVASAIAGRIGNSNNAKMEDSPEVEILFAPGQGSFSGRADCNILVAFYRLDRSQQIVADADVVVSSEPIANRQDILQFPLDHWEQALEAVA
jgi:glycosyltransferase involved in cell wall biosynthesis